MERDEIEYKIQGNFIEELSKKISSCMKSNIKLNWY